jgi:copper transport protein
MIVLQLVGLMGRAAQKHTGLMETITAGGAREEFQLACIALFFICFALAAQRMRAVWMIAGVVGIAYALRNITTGRWFSNINPWHETAASLWLGTLAVMMLAGMSAAFAKSISAQERGRVVAEMVSRFSPLALTAAALLGITGIITAWKHLKHWNALWSTPYGFALDAKLCVVAVVVALGAWNWRRMAPNLGDESAAIGISKSASTELSFAAVVLAITALLVSLPSPSGGGPPGERPPGAQMKSATSPQ